MEAQFEEKIKIIYVYDALCGWCYGFSPVMQSFATKYNEQLYFEVISGGMVIGKRIGPIGEVAPYIAWAYKEVERTCGVKFGESFLKNILAEGKAIFSSEPPALAMLVFKKYKTEQSISFAGRLQKAIYFEGIEPENWEAYGILAAEFGLDKDSFIQEMQKPATLEMVKKEFALTASWGVSGFPTVFLLYQNSLYPLARGYVSLEQLENQFHKILKQQKK